MNPMEIIEDNFNSIEVFIESLMGKSLFNDDALSNENIYTESSNVNTPLTEGQAIMLEQDIISASSDIDNFINEMGGES